MAQFIAQTTSSEGKEDHQTAKPYGFETHC